MSKEKIEQAYKRWIIPESKNPHHFEKQPTSSIEAYNPICGDKYEIFTDVPYHFYGHGCALSKASTSLLMRQLEHRPKTELITFIQSFIQSVENGETDKTFDSSLNILIELKHYDGREDCILLAWRVMLKHLKQTQNNQ